MANLLKHRGYCGTVDVDLDSGILCGSVLYINSLLVYEASTVEELRERFKEVVDEYLDDCKREGIDPDKPCSGSFNIRINPELHRQLAMLATENDRSLNEEVRAAIEEHVERYRLSDKPDGVSVSYSQPSQDVGQIPEDYVPQFTNLVKKDEVKEG